MRFSWLYGIIFLELVGFRRLNFVTKRERFVDTACLGRVKRIALDGGAVRNRSDDSRDCKESHVGRVDHAVKEETLKRAPC